MGVLNRILGRNSVRTYYYKETKTTPVAYEKHSKEINTIKSTCLFLFCQTLGLVGRSFCKVNYQLFNFSNKTIWYEAFGVVVKEKQINSPAPNIYDSGINLHLHWKVLTGSSGAAVRERGEEGKERTR